MFVAVNLPVSLFGDLLTLSSILLTGLVQLTSRNVLWFVPVSSAKLACGTGVLQKSTDNHVASFSIPVIMLLGLFTWLKLHAVILSEGLMDPYCHSIQMEVWTIQSFRKSILSCCHNASLLSVFFCSLVCVS